MKPFSRSNPFQELDLRRRELGLTLMELARKSGLSFSTVHRILAGRCPNPSWDNLAILAEWLGMTIHFQPAADAQALRESQANAKAEKLVRMVQGTSALEAQAINSDQRRRMIRETVRELLAGPKRRLWED